MDVVALLTTSQGGANAFLNQPHLPNNVPVHVFVVPRQKCPVLDDATGDVKEWRTSWFRGRDPHSAAVGAGHQHVLRSMLRLYPDARSVLVFEDDARMQLKSVDVLRNCFEWMNTHDDWDLFFLGHYPLGPTRLVAENVVVTPNPVAAHAIVYNKRIIPEVLGWNFYSSAIDERIAFQTPSWKKYAAYPDVFYQCREPILSRIARALWPWLPGLPYVQTETPAAFALDFNRVMLQEDVVGPLIVAVVATSVLLGSMVALWVHRFRHHP